MDVLILSFLVLCAAALFWSLGHPSLALARSAKPVAEATAESAPRRIVNPRHAAPDVKVWILRASPDCTLTKSLLDGHRYAREEALSLPLIGCRQHDCRCHYEPVYEGRRAERRQSQDRRDAFRFEAKRDRRYHTDRRLTNGWTHTLLR